VLLREKDLVLVEEPTQYHFASSAIILVHLIQDSLEYLGFEDAADYLERDLLDWS